LLSTYVSTIWNLYKTDTSAVVKFATQLKSQTTKQQIKSKSTHEFKMQLRNKTVSSKPPYKAPNQMKNSSLLKTKNLLKKNQNQDKSKQQIKKKIDLKDIAKLIDVDNNVNPINCANIMEVMIS